MKKPSGPQSRRLGAQAGAAAGQLTQGRGHQLAAHPLDRHGDRAEGQVLGQDRAVDGGEGLLAREAHGKHAEVALPGTRRTPSGRPRGPACGRGCLLVGGEGADPAHGPEGHVGVVRTDRCPPCAKTPSSIDRVPNRQIHTARSPATFWRRRESVSAQAWSILGPRLLDTSAGRSCWGGVAGAIQDIL